MLRHLILTAAATTLALPAAAGTITQWNFNSVPPDPSPGAGTGTGTLTPSIGSGTISTFGGTTATFATAAGNGDSTDPATTDDSGWNISTFAAQGAGNKTRGLEFSVSTLGFENIVISFDQRNSNTAARTTVVQYSTDGLNFTDAATFTTTTAELWFDNRTVDLSAITAVDNLATLTVRVVAAFTNASAYAATNSANTYAANGTWRFDMLTVSGDAIPPVTIVPLPPAALAGLSLLACLPLAQALRRKA
jgi:hypothetical protein